MPLTFNRMKVCAVGLHTLRSSHGGRSRAATGDAGWANARTDGYAKWPRASCALHIISSPSARRKISRSRNRLVLRSYLTQSLSEGEPSVPDLSSPLSYIHSSKPSAVA